MKRSLFVCGPFGLGDEELIFARDLLEDGESCAKSRIRDFRWTLEGR